MDTAAGQYQTITQRELENVWQASATNVPVHPDQAVAAAPEQLLPPLHHLVAEVEDKDAELQPEGQKLAAARSFKFDTITVVARLDRASPLTEAKWVRTGNVDDWIASVSGPTLVDDTSGDRHQRPEGAPSSSSPSSAPSSKPRSGSAWKGKIKVADPDAVRFFPSSRRSMPTLTDTACVWFFDS